MVNRLLTLWRVRGSWASLRWAPIPFRVHLCRHRCQWAVAHLLWLSNKTLGAWLGPNHHLRKWISTLIMINTHTHTHTHNEMKLNEIKLNQIKSNQIKSNQMKWLISAVVTIDFLAPIDTGWHRMRNSRWLNESDWLITISCFVWIMLSRMASVRVAADTGFFTTKMFKFQSQFRSSYRSFITVTVIIVITVSIVIIVMITRNRFLMQFKSN